MSYGDVIVFFCGQIKPAHSVVTERRPTIFLYCFPLLRTVLPWCAKNHMFQKKHAQAAHDEGVADDGAQHLEVLHEDCFRRKGDDQREHHRHGHNDSASGAVNKSAGGDHVKS